MNTADLRAMVREDVSGAFKRYLADFDALAEDHLLSSPGGSARSGIDFSYEVYVVNERILSRVLGQEPGAWPYEGWVSAPDDKRTKADVHALMQASFDALLAAWDALSDQEAEERVKQMLFASLHANYHSAQLNYIQSLHGDMEVHWS